MTSLNAQLACLGAGLIAGAVAPLAARQLLTALASFHRIEPSTLGVSVGSGHGMRAILCALGCGALGLALLERLGASPLVGFIGAACYVLVILSLIDLRARLLPDFLTFPMLAAGLAINSAGTLATLPSALCGAALGFGSLWAARELSMRTWRKTEGIGLGDAKLLAALGAWVGWNPVVEILIAAAIAACAAGALQLCFRRSTEAQVLAFGPFIAAAGIAALLAWPFSLAEVLASLI